MPTLARADQRGLHVLASTGANHTVAECCADEKDIAALLERTRILTKVDPKQPHADVVQRPVLAYGAVKLITASRAQASSDLGMQQKRDHDGSLRIVFFRAPAVFDLASCLKLIESTATNLDTAYELVDCIFGCVKAHLP